MKTPGREPYRHVSPECQQKKGAKKRFCYIDWLILTARKHTLIYSREMLIHSLKILS